MSFALATSLSNLETIGENVSSGLIAACLLFTGVAGIAASCDRYKPWWLIFGLALLTGSFTNIVYLWLNAQYRTKLEK